MWTRTRDRLTGGSVVLLGWALGSLFGPLPAPTAVLARIPALFAPGPGGALAAHLQASLRRIIVTTGIALAIATGGGLAMALDERVERAVETWLPLWMTITTLVVVLVAMVLAAFSEWSVLLAAVVVVTPYATVTVRQGVATIDSATLAMVRSVGAGPRLRLREVYLPAVLPALFGSTRYLLSMTWKVVVLAETFGMQRGMGALFRYWFEQGAVTALLAALAVFVPVMIGLQRGLTRVESRAFAWRG